jgi:hypothetical protein
MVRQQRCAVRSIRTRGVGTSRDGHHRSRQPGLIPVRPRSAMRRASMVGSCVPGGAEDRRPHDWIRTVVAAHLLRVPGLPAHLVERGRHRSGVLVPAGSGRLLRLARQSSLPATVRPADLPPAQGGGHPAPDAALTRENRPYTRGTTAARGAWQEARKRNGPLQRPGGDCGMPLRGRDRSPAGPSRNSRAAGGSACPGPRLLPVGGITSSEPIPRLLSRPRWER